MSSLMSSPFRLLLVLLVSFAQVPQLFAQGGTAVITLVMPVGARQLGMGETAIAIPDDVFATFWNPSGLAFGPLSDEWELAKPAKHKENGLELIREFKVLAAKPRTGFLYRPIVWAGAKDQLMRYDGKSWKGYEEHVMETGEQIETVLRTWIGSGDNLDSILKIVLKYNEIENKEDEESLISLKLPFDLIFNSPINALILDQQDRLWVGTDRGLYQYNGKTWKSFARETAFGLLDSSAGDRTNQPRKVTALAVKGKSIWIGTEDGLFEYDKQNIYRRGSELLPSQYINAISTHPDIDEIYVGLREKGIARYRPKRGKKPASWRLYQSKDGLIDSEVHNLLTDKYGHVWAAHNGGVSHFNLRAWEKVFFKGQNISTLALNEDGSIWIGTDQGAWKHTPPYTTAKGRRQSSEELVETNEEKSRTEKYGAWTHYHTGNGLSNKNVVDIETQGSDVWFITEGGIERYNAAKSQVGFFYENLLPVLNLKDLFHAFMGVSFPVEDWGTVGGFINFVSFGQNQLVNARGEVEATFDSREWVGALSYGTRMTKNSSLGLNVKFIYSSLAKGITATGEESDGVAASYAMDLGFLWKNVALKGLSFGLVAQNMGPAVFYVDQAQSDPIPFTWKVGTAYEVVRTANHKLTVAADANREVSYREGNDVVPFWIAAWKGLAYPCSEDNPGCNPINHNLYLTVYNTGMEYTYANVVSGRAGYLFDESGKRFEADMGLGFMVSDILQLDGSFIRSFEGGIRDKQMRLSMLVRF